MIYFDTETCGLYGPIVLIQWAEDDGKVQLYSPWKNPIRDTMSLIEKIVESEICGFNLAFDWFHICQMYTTLQLFPDYDDYLEDVKDQYAQLEPQGRDGPCLKPKAACDLMLHARRGPYQSMMNREDIRIKRIPTCLVHQLSRELDRRIPMKDIYFAKRKNKHAPKWEVYDIEEWDGTINPELKDIVLKFNPSSALKALAADAFKLPADEILMYDDVEVPEKMYPEELGYAPYALAMGNSLNWHGAWPDVIDYHITHWSYNERARVYAEKDVVYTRDLHKFFGSPKPGDVDSELACMVAAVRWKGFQVDIPGLKALKEETKARQKIVVDGRTWSIPTAPADSRRYITAVMSDTEKEILNDSTKKILLEEIAKWQGDCPVCGLTKSEEVYECPSCKNQTILPPHPAAIRAKQVLEARQAGYEEDLYDKFILAGRFHASFNVIGALSSRMSGADGLNAQGVKKEKTIRSKFPLARAPMILCGGDFSGFEVTLAEAVYNDDGLRQDLLSGKKIHALFGQFVYPGQTYEQILKSEGTDYDMYTRSKQAVFSMMYGGTEHTLMDRLGVELDVAIAAKERFHKKYPGVGLEEKRITDMFGSMRQPGGIGTKVVWNEPHEYVESLFGFRRYFTLENRICKELYTLSNDPPKDWRTIPVKVQRRDRVQTAGGALQSALYAAAFAIQAGIVRAARNHRIQSSGAEITKKVQVEIWGIQPCGIHPWLVQPMNIHDEIQCPCDPSVTGKVKQVVKDCVETFRPTVPLIKMDWSIGLNSWAEKS